MINFTHKMAKAMLNHIKKQCFSLTNTESKDLLKVTELPWNPEEDIAVYFTKLYKEQEMLKKVGMNWDDSQKVMQVVYEIYYS